MLSPHYVRLVRALALGGLAVLGVGGCETYDCECPVDAAVGREAGGSGIGPSGPIAIYAGRCSAAEVDAGCGMRVQPSGPLSPPELSPFS